MKGLVLPIAMLLGACSGGNEEHALEPPLPATPRLPSMENFRDLAGADAASVYRNTEGRALRRGVFYRSNLVAPNDADLDILNGLGIAAVYDLRTLGEIAKAPDRLPQGAAYVPVNVLGSEDAFPHSFFTSAEHAIQTLEDIHRQMVTDADIRARLAQILTTMAHTNGAQIFHCTAGKDRTGWVAALLHTIAGVPEETITRDYLLTNTYTEHWMATTKQAMLKQHDQAFVDAISPILGVQERFLHAGFTQAVDSYGSMEGYIREGLALDVQVLEALRGKLLE